MLPYVAIQQRENSKQASPCRHVLRDESEHAMVRHEAAEALGSIASPDCLQLLTDYCKDPEPIVADSCVVSICITLFSLSVMSMTLVLLLPSGGMI